VRYANVITGWTAYRNEHFGEWVDALLAADLDGAKSRAATMTNVPALITRDLAKLKEWLFLRRHGGRRPGLIVSSGAVRLVADGVPPAPMSNELKSIENWFLKSWPDFRGSDSLDTPLSEFGCQGLELDYVGLCWGGDLPWSREQARWVPRRMRAPSWQAILKNEAARHRVNAYRVLLTRAREGLCIYIPHGSAEDPTRNPLEFDAIADALLAAGCAVLAHDEAL
jgi:Schlafen group 3, DNA/RNA helicase domain